MYPSPVLIADVITSTTHKTLRGPRGGFIISKSESLSKRINAGVFPGTQGGPLMHTIAAKAVAFKEAFSKDFIYYQKRLLKNSKLLSFLLIKNKFDIISGITDNHLLLLNLSNTYINGKQAEDALYSCYIITNKNMIPNDKRKPNTTSGIRLGSPSITSRGFGSNEIFIVSNWISDIIKDSSNKTLLKKIKKDVLKICKLFPVHKSIT